MRTVVVAAAILWLATRSANAADAPQTLLYVVNATGLPFQMAMDAGTPSPSMAHLVGAMRPIKAGPHVLTGNVQGEPSASTTLDLKEEDLAEMSTGSMAFWCVVVGRRPSAELVFIRATPPQCGDLILKAVDGLPKR
ncbi:hypothetical protein [Phenylobacterium aquaticum]|uniref:hypothetical protein n=1 Tax=Phenylobacterium aquaticum TaxID=1763816 RepID=UPI0026F03618|nr:hypothetical protein [Phenylobacterium aquaticum]